MTITDQIKKQQQTTKKTNTPNNSLHLIRRHSELLRHIPNSSQIVLANGAQSSTPESAVMQMGCKSRATGLQTIDRVKCLLRRQRLRSAVRSASGDSCLVVKNKHQQRKPSQDEARPPTPSRCCRGKIGKRHRPLSPQPGKI